MRVRIPLETPLETKIRLHLGYARCGAKPRRAGSVAALAVNLQQPKSLDATAEDAILRNDVVDLS